MIKIRENREEMIYFVADSGDVPQKVEIKISDDESFLTHELKLNMVDDFVEEFVGGREVFIGVKEEDKGKLITGVDGITIHADYVKLTGKKEGEFFSFTPFKLGTCPKNSLKKLQKKKISSRNHLSKKPLNHQKKKISI